MKRDYLASQTGRLYVEFWNNRKKSNPRVAERKYHGFDPEKWVVKGATKEMMDQLRKDNLEYFEN
jgi:hypothetical protein